MRHALEKCTNLTAMIPVMGTPMFSNEWASLVDDYPDVLFVVGDDLPMQVQYLSSGKVNGLVGQVSKNARVSVMMFLGNSISLRDK